MLKCKVFGLFFFILPLKKWQGFLIEKHVKKCPGCQNGLASETEVRTSLAQLIEDQGKVDMWPAINAGLQEEKERNRHSPGPQWKWALGTVSLLAFLAAALFLYRGLSLRRSLPEGDLVERFQINYIRVKGKPAQAFLYQPKDSEMIIIWAEESR